ncbi:MAG: NADH-quinone oxidoreductase subunit C [Verrucomicrobia bacterium]|nr:NADH-quinone oxidoreductase subunit C [Verrucomicrobiota bacterium]
METLNQIKDRIEAAVPSVRLAIEGRSLVVDREHLLEVARFLKNDAELAMDYVSNLCAVDWLPRKVKVKEGGQDVEKDLPGFLEVVYDFYSMAKKHGPLQLRCRTDGREGMLSLPSITPLFRGAEFQEREAFDLYGIRFKGHPDLRRILMWDGFKDFPMRKDYQQPDDHEWEPTPHDEVLQQAKKHWPAPSAAPVKPA